MRFHVDTRGEAMAVARGSLAVACSLSVVGTRPVFLVHCLAMSSEFGVRKEFHSTSRQMRSCLENCVFCEPTVPAWYDLLPGIGIFSPFRPGSRTPSLRRSTHTHIGQRGERYVHTFPKQAMKDNNMTYMINGQETIRCTNH